MPHGGEGQDAGGGAVAQRLQTVTKVNCVAPTDRASGHSRVVGVEVLFKLVAGARGDLVNTWTSHFHMIHYFAPVLYLANSHTDLFAQSAVL